jgi:hypothetical protein
MALNDSNPGSMPGNAERDARLDRLYRAGGREEPPARLDAAILAAARREVGARPRPLYSALRRWRVPVSIAAVVVLSVSLVMLIKEEGGEALLQAPRTVAPSSPPIAQPAEPAAALPDSAPVRPQAGAPARQRKDAGARAPTALGKMAADSVAGGSGLAATESAGTAAPDASARPQSQPFRDYARMDERPSPAPQVVPGGDLEASPPVIAERRATPMAAAPGPEPAGARSMMQARKEPASADDKLPVWRGYEKEPPQKWLERISELKRQGRIVDADAMLAEFGRRFPGYPLPSGLQ